MILEGFVIALGNALGLPIGAKIRKPNSKSNFEDAGNELTEDLVNSIIDISKDDVCVGEAPMFFQSQKKRLNKTFVAKLQMVCEAFNKIATWVAFDILKEGVSVYHYYMVGDGDDKVLVFRPVVVNVELYLRRDNTIKVVDVEKTEEIENVIAFVYFDKNMLTVVEDSEEDLLLINPQGIQTKNARKAVQDLAVTEKAIQRLRVDSSRVVRFLSVEVGVNKGNNQQNVVDDVSEGINANSISLQSTTEFDDQIPVYPTRKGLGKPELTQEYSQADMGDLADLDYDLSKLFLAMRFPKSYADFSTNLTPTAVSMIRGDIRYAKLLLAARSLIERTFNDFMEGVYEIKKAGVKFKLTQVPTSEDDDLINVLTTYTDFAEAAWVYVSESATKEEALAKLESLRVLYSTSTNQEGIEKWAESVINVINKKYENPQEGLGDEGLENLEDLGGMADEAIENELGAEEVSVDEEG